MFNLGLTNKLGWPFFFCTGKHLVETQWPSRDDEAVKCSRGAFRVPLDNNDNKLCVVRWGRRWQSRSGSLPSLFVELLVPLTRPAPAAPARTWGQRRCCQGLLTRPAPAAPSTRHWTQICGTYEHVQPTPGEWTWISGQFNKGLKEPWLLLATLSLFFFCLFFFNMALCADMGFVPNHAAHTQHMFNYVFLYLFIHHLWLRQTTV